MRPSSLPSEFHTVTPNLPQQTLDITYDYGPGPQPVPVQSPTP